MPGEAQDIIGVPELLEDCDVVPKDLEECLTRLKEFVEPFVALLPRSELRGHGEDVIRGLLSDLERKSAEPIAERAGKDRDRIQYFVGQSPWDHVPLLDELRRQVAQEIGSPKGVSVLDSSGFPKKGEASVGVARQWCGRLGKVDNCQKGLFLGYVSNFGQVLVDERLYLPEEWAKDAGRRDMCHVPKEVKFKTIHELSLEMLEKQRGLLPHRWVTGDDEFGRVPWFREKLRGAGERYLLEIPGHLLVCDAEDPPRAGMMGRPRKAAFQQAGRWKDEVRQRDWVRIHIRDGVKGPIVVWATRARVKTRSRAKRGRDVEWLLVTRTESETPEYRYYLSNGEVNVPIEEMAHAANARHWIEDCFERAKGRVGMDHYEVRSWGGWHHHMTLSLLALWFLVREQRRLSNATPAITVQQSAEAIGELLRNPEMNTRELAHKITARLRRTEQARIDHWRKFKRLPPRWTEARSSNVRQ